MSDCFKRNQDIIMFNNLQEYTVWCFKTKTSFGLNNVRIQLNLTSKDLQNTLLSRFWREIDEM